MREHLSTADDQEEPRMLSDCLNGFISANFVSAFVCLLLQWQRASAAVPLRAIVLPKTCDVVTIKSAESNRYLGVSLPYSSGSGVNATHSYDDAGSRFVVNYFGSASGPMALTVQASGTAVSKKSLLLLGFNGSQGVLKSWAYGNYSYVKQPNDTLLMLGGWPVVNISYGGSSTVLAGPYFRLYLLEDAYPNSARAVVGVDGSGRLMLYPMDAADTPNVAFINPSTLFLFNVVSSPGSSACPQMAG